MECLSLGFEKHEECERNGMGAIAGTAGSLGPLDFYPTSSRHIERDNIPREHTLRSGGGRI